LSIGKAAIRVSNHISSQRSHSTTNPANRKQDMENSSKQTPIPTQSNMAYYYNAFLFIRTIYGELRGKLLGWAGDKKCGYEPKLARARHKKIGWWWVGGWLIRWVDGCWNQWTIRDVASHLLPIQSIQLVANYFELSHGAKSSKANL